MPSERRGQGGPLCGGLLYASAAMSNRNELQFCLVKLHVFSVTFTPLPCGVCMYIPPPPHLPLLYAVRGLHIQHVCCNPCIFFLVVTSVWKTV